MVVLGPGQGGAEAVVGPDAEGEIEAVGERVSCARRGAVARLGIRVVSIAPGIFDTPMLASLVKSAAWTWPASDRKRAPTNLRMLRFVIIVFCVSLGQVLPRRTNRIQ